jgi:hypothetical protein
MGCVIVGEFGEREEVRPIILLVIDVYSQVLLEDLVDSFGLTIGLRVVDSG